MSTPPDPFEFVRNLWGQMGIPGFGAGSTPAMPSFAPEELEKRIGELKQIRQWLEINLNMLNLQVNGLEMQLSAIKGFNASPGGEMAAHATKAMQDAVSGKNVFSTPPAGFGANPQYAQPGFGGFPFGAAVAAAPSPPPAPEPPPAEPPAPELPKAKPVAARSSKASKASAEAAKAPAWPDPTSWMQSLQAEFVKNMKSISPDTGAAAPRKAAAKKSGAKSSTAKRTSAKKRTRGTP
jgi:hypothetical protein